MQGPIIFPVDIFPSDVFPYDVFPTDVFPREEPITDKEQSSETDNTH